jgi:hypothetical protein
VIQALKPEVARYHQLRQSHFLRFESRRHIQPHAFSKACRRGSERRLNQVIETPIAGGDGQCLDARCYLEGKTEGQVVDGKIQVLRTEAVKALMKYLRGGHFRA